MRAVRGQHPGGRAGGLPELRGGATVAVAGAHAARAMSAAEAGRARRQPGHGRRLVPAVYQVWPSLRGSSASSSCQNCF